MMFPRLRFGASLDGRARNSTALPTGTCGQRIANESDASLYGAKTDLIALVDPDFATVTSERERNAHMARQFDGYA
jgi:hypothetical protein